MISSRAKTDSLDIIYYLPIHIISNVTRQLSDKIMLTMKREGLLLCWFLVLLVEFTAGFSIQKQYSASTTTTTTSSRRDFLNNVAAATSAAIMIPQKGTAMDVGGKMVLGGEDIMNQKAHGTSDQPVQSDLLYGVSNQLADKICNFNRHFAERGGYFLTTSFEDVVLEAKGPITFYDSVTGKALFVAPINRSPDAFLKESEIHGWPSFRDEEVVWENVRVLKGSGETVSVDGTHLGHNIPDKKGNRYCINLVSVAGKPKMS